MNLTSKSRYALKIMIDLSTKFGQDLVKRHEIVVRQGIPAHYMDQIILKLRKAGLVDSVRGRAGGYRVARSPRQITVWDIFNAVEDGLYPALCVDEHAQCAFAQNCIAVEPWQEIFEAVKATLSCLHLSELRGGKRFIAVPREHKVFECRSGRDV